MKEIHSRTVALIGEEAQKKLSDSRVIIFGVGGVGGHLCEALARAGVGHLTLVDADRVSESNINRQLFALRSTVGKFKTEAARDRIRDIDPDIEVVCRNEFFLPECSDTFPLSEYDYVADCIDTVSGKIELAVKCEAGGIPLIASMGAANKINCVGFEVTDIYKTSVCPLARVMRNALKSRRVKHLKVVYSKEVPRKSNSEEKDRNGRTVPASISYVPSSVGLIMAGEIIKDITKIK